MKLAFFPILFFYWLTGLNNLRHARHHDYFSNDNVFFVLFCWWPSRRRQQRLILLCRVSPGTWSETPCKANLNSGLQPAFEHQEVKISILEVVSVLYSDWSLEVLNVIANIVGNKRWQKFLAELVQPLALARILQRTRRQTINSLNFCLQKIKPFGASRQLY